jgi:predicted nucleic acid-binding protein
MSDDRSFVDTNVLVYAYDADAGAKHDIANRLLTRLWNDRAGATSIQVLQEFYVNATRKLRTPLPKRTAREVVATYEVWVPHRPTVDDIVAASELEERRRLSFWDALIVVSAQQTTSVTLLSDDLQDGQRFGSVNVSNPFSAKDPRGFE